MNIKFIKELSITSSGNEFIDLIPDGMGDEIVNEVVLQVASNATVSVKGNVKDGETALAIACIKQSDLSVVSSISASGIYIVPCEGLSSISLEVTGTTDIIVKAIG